MDRRGAWERLGFANLEHYAEERLGWCRTTAWNRVSLARGLHHLPRLRRAYEAGRVGLESALLVRRALGMGPVPEAIERAWVQLAERRTVKLLRDQVRALHRHEAGLADGPDPGTGRTNREDGSNPQVGTPVEQAPMPLSDAEWFASLFRAPGTSRARLEQLAIGMLAGGTPPRADVFLRLRIPVEAARQFLAAIEGARQQLELKSGVDPPEASHTLRIARMFSQRPLPAWLGLLALLEDYVDTWDRVELTPRRQWDPTYRRAGFRCMAPGCTARAQLEDHHLWYRSARGPNDAWNQLCLCHAHHQHGEHGTLARCRGRAPLDVLWRLGREDLATWWRNEERLDPDASEEEHAG